MEPLGESPGGHTTLAPDESPPADAQLLELVADRSALGPLYDRYSNLVYGLALAILGSREEAEDLGQEMFAKAGALQ